MAQKTVLSTSILAALVSMTGAGTLFAQDDEGGLEVIAVTGVRQSLINSMNSKRNAIGVVDSVTAEDIGKFPNTNLAESLQRIPGVSIDRANGAGSQVTVRGFGPDFNLVTLNGRVLPTATIGIIGQRDNYAAASLSEILLLKASVNCKSTRPARRCCRPVGLAR
jgi:outer membrane receptor for ferrienterochelin and colicin